MIYKVGLVFGTRPEIIKLAPIIEELQNYEDIELTVISTGQHESLRDIAIQDFNIGIDVELNLMLPNSTLAEFGANSLLKLSNYFKAKKFDGLIVQGDTSSALYSALAGFYLGIPIFYVESGLRSWDMTQPFPEEMNRTLISKVAEINFAPTPTSKNNLLKENISENKIKVTGNTIVDVLLKIKSGSYKASKLGNCDVLVTLHRRENHKLLPYLFETINNLAKVNSKLRFQIISHPNPNVLKVIESMEFAENIQILSPQSYFNFISKLVEAKIIISDSGGIQEESVTLGKKVIVLREKTERSEGIDMGLIKLISPSCPDLYVQLNKLTNEYLNNSENTKVTDVYGQGNASKIICKEIHLSLQNK
jgi:UDP-N-acetylglucosamine 2-epimerase (non-hydrolysing)